MRAAARFFILLVSAVWLALSSSGQTVINPYYTVQDFGLSTATIRSVILTPIAPAGDYNNGFLVSQPIYQASYTNGTAVFSNIVAGYAYQVAFNTTYSTSYRTNFFPTGLTNTITGQVNAHNYLGLITGFASDGSVIQFAYFTATNYGVTTNYTTLYTTNIYNITNNLTGTNVYGLTNGVATNGTSVVVSGQTLFIPVGDTNGAATNAAALERLALISTNSATLTTATNLSAAERAAMILTNLNEVARVTTQIGLTNANNLATLNSVSNQLSTNFYALIISGTNSVIVYSSNATAVVSNALSARIISATNSIAIWTLASFQPLNVNLNQWSGYSTNGYFQMITGYVGTASIPFANITGASTLAQWNLQGTNLFTSVAAANALSNNLTTAQLSISNFLAGSIVAATNGTFVWAKITFDPTNSAVNALAASRAFSQTNPLPYNIITNPPMLYSGLTATNSFDPTNSASNAIAIDKAALIATNGLILTNIMVTASNAQAITTNFYNLSQTNLNLTNGLIQAWFIAQGYLKTTGTNGLATISFVNAVSNTLAGQILNTTNGATVPFVTNYVAGASNGIVSIFQSGTNTLFLNFQSLLNTYGINGSNNVIAASNNIITLAKTFTNNLVSFPALTNFSLTLDTNKAGLAAAFAATNQLGSAAWQPSSAFISPQGATNAANAIGAAGTNYANSRQVGSLTLTNLAITGANTNPLVAGTNFNLSTNFQGIISLNATNQSFLTNGYPWSPLYDTNGAGTTAAAAASLAQGNANTNNELALYNSSLTIASNLATTVNYNATNFSSTNLNNLYVKSLNGNATNLDISNLLILGTATNFIQSQNLIGIRGAAIVQANGTYQLLTGGLWTNYQQSGYSILLSGGNYYIRTNMTSQYQFTNINGGQATVVLGNGIAPAPFASYGSYWDLNGVVFTGFEWGTNEYYKITNAIARLAPQSVINANSNTAYYFGNSNNVFYGTFVGTNTTSSTNAFYLGGIYYTSYITTNNAVSIFSNSATFINFITNAAGNPALGGVLSGTAANAGFSLYGTNTIDGEIPKFAITNLAPGANITFTPISGGYSIAAASGGGGGGGTNLGGAASVAWGTTTNLTANSLPALTYYYFPPPPYNSTNFPYSIVYTNIPAFWQTNFGGGGTTIIYPTNGGYIFWLNGNGTNTSIYSDGTKPPLAVYGSSFATAGSYFTNYSALKIYTSDPQSVYGSNKLSHVIGEAYSVYPQAIGAATNGVFDEEESFAGNNTTNFSDRNGFNPDQNGDSFSYDNLTLYRHKFYDYEVDKEYTNLDVPPAAFTVSITNVNGRQSVLYRFDGAHADPYPLPSVISSDYFVGNNLVVDTNNSTNPPAATYPTSIDPAIATYFSTCQSPSATNVVTIPVLIDRFFAPYGTYFLYYNITNVYGTTNVYYTTTQLTPPYLNLVRLSTNTLKYAVPTNYTIAPVQGDLAMPSIFNVYSTAYVTNYTYSTVAPSTIAALNQMIFSLKQNNLWTNFSAIYPFAGGTTCADANNLISTNYTITWNGFLTNASAHGNYGITNDGSFSYGDSGFQETRIGNYCYGVYLVTSNTLDGGMFGYADSSGGSIASGLSFSNELFYATEQSSGSSQASGVSFSLYGNKNFIAVSRMDGNLIIQTNLANFTVANSVASTYPDSHYYIGKLNNVTLPTSSQTNSAAASYGFAFIGSNFSAANLSTVQSIVAQYESDMGR